jgi:hypothetical protein
MKTVTETDTAPQRRVGSQNGRDKQIKKLIKRYEATVFSFFRELNLPLKFREIIRGYILASDGETVFEASYNELTDVLFKRAAARLPSNREMVRYNAEALQKWQDKHKVELIRVLQKGRKISRPDGSEEYQKTKYQLVLLEELVRVLYGCPENEMKSRVKEAVARMRGNYTPDDHKRQVPTRFMLERNRRTILTKFGRVFEQAEQVNLNPVEECQALIFKLQARLDEITSVRDEERKREGYISAFHDSVTDTKSEAYADRGVENYHTSITINGAGILPSDNRLVGDWQGGAESGEPTGNESVETLKNKHLTFLNSKLAEKFSDNPLENAALHYAIAGYPIFPLHNPVFAGDSARCSCRDWQTCNKVGKHPRTRFGVSEATTDLETIRQWWRKWPNANIGLATGEASGIFVLDVDPKAGGDYSLEDLEDSYGALPGTLRQRTGSNGQHRIFRYPDVRIRNSASEIAPGLDIRGEGGYIVAAPSIHASGNHYHWHGVNTPVENAPDWFIALILISEEEPAQDTKQASASILVPARGEIIREGEGRNNFIFRQGSGLVNNFSPQEVRRRLEAKNLSRCEPPLDEKELSKIFKSVERYRPSQIH